MGIEEKAFHGRSRSGRQKKFYSFAKAEEYIGNISHGCEIFGLSKGQFSLFDILETVLDQTGPANVVIATWTAAGAETQRAKEFIENGNIKSLRWIVDRSFQSRQPEYCQILTDTFGDCVRTLRTHAKFLLIYNDEWNFVIRTSMNFNSNPRMEDFEISEDSDFLTYMKMYVDDIFNTTITEDNFNNSSDMDKIRAFDDDAAAVAQSAGVKKPEPANKLDSASLSTRLLGIKEGTELANMELAQERAKIEKIKRQTLERENIPVKKFRVLQNNCKFKACNTCRQVIDDLFEDFQKNL